jgi:hypothetical protein
MVNTTKPTPLQNGPKHLRVKGSRAKLPPTSPTIPTGTLIAQLDVTSVEKTAQQLSSKAVLDLFKMILTGASLNEVLIRLARTLEAQAEGMLCSIWLLEKDGVDIEEIGQPDYLRLISNSDVFTPTGRTKVGVIWDLSVKKIDDRTCEITNTVHSSATPELMDFLGKLGIPWEVLQGARKPVSEAHNRQETPLFAKSIERHPLRDK